MRVAFFGHDADDAAVRRRIASMQAAGADLIGYTMRRGEARACSWENVDLGLTKDAAFGQRLQRLALAAPRLALRRRELRAADIFYARNLDMLALAWQAKILTGARARLVYECLDIHRAMHSPGAAGRLMRRAERFLLARSRMLVVSSPGFLSGYFEPVHGRLPPTALIENKMPTGLVYAPRPAPSSPPPALAPSQDAKGGPLRIGYVGALRCQRSFDLLCAAARALPGRVEIALHGYSSELNIPGFESKAAAAPGVTLHGRYRHPDDLAAIYGALDLVWAGDFHDAGYNSDWLLPNRLYEGGFYGAVPLCHEGVETARWIEAMGAGFTLPEPLEDSLPAFLAALEPEALAKARRKLLSAPEAAFRQDEGEIAGLLETIMAAA